jgi:hypothetical protein
VIDKSTRIYYGLILSHFRVERMGNKPHFAYFGINDDYSKFYNVEMIIWILGGVVV